MFNPVSCGICIAKLADKVRGYDPREMVKDCAWSTLRKGRGGKAFRNCMIRKLKNAGHDATHADRVATEMWDKIKNKCKG